MPRYNGALHEFLKHAIPDYLVTSFSLDQGCQTHFHWGPRQPRSCLQRAEIILGLYKYNYSLTVKELKLRSAHSGNGPGKNEFETPALDCQVKG